MVVVVYVRCIVLVVVVVREGLENSFLAVLR